MNLIIQVLLLNLVICCENVGVFALATKGMPTHTAVKVHWIGVCVSLTFKFIFIMIASILFSVPWLHIRIVGGVVLLYIIYNMLFPHPHEENQNNGNEKDSLFDAVISISVAVISMSLDDAIAITSIISLNNSALDVQKLVIVIAGLLFGAYILLRFSNIMIKVIERLPILNYLFTGYLAYMAFMMIFEDETIVLFFQRIKFTFTTPAAVLSGILIVFYGILNSSFPYESKTKGKGGYFILYSVVVIYAFVVVGAITYLETNPFVGGHTYSFEYPPNGANAIYTIAHASHLITVCAAIMAGKTAKEFGYKNYFRLFFLNMKEMITYILLVLIVCTIGLSYVFEFGTIAPSDYLTAFAIQTLMLCSYAAAFTMISTFAKGKKMIIIIGLLYILLEPIEAAAFIFSTQFPVVAYFFPAYHMAAVLGDVPNNYTTAMTLLIPILYITLFTYIGFSHFQSDLIISEKKQ